MVLDGEALLVVEERAQHADAMVARGHGEQRDRADVRARVEREALAHAQVARDGEATFLASHQDVRAGFALDAEPDVGAVALLPVTAGGHRIGVLGAYFHDEQRFTVEDHEYLAALAGISGLALARAG